MNTNSSQPPVKTTNTKNKLSTAEAFRRTYVAFLPGNLDIDNILLNNPIQVRYHKSNPQKIRNNLIYILSVIYNKLKKSDNGLPLQNKTSEYSNLCSTFLENIIHNYKQYLSWLESVGILECDHIFKEKHKCRGYRYSDLYRNSLIQPRKEVIYDQQLWERLQDIRQPSEVMSTYPELIGWFDHLSIDIKQSERILQELGSPNHQLAIHRLRLNNIKFKERRFYKIGRTGRFYTPLCTLKRELRDSVMVDGSKLVECDLKSSIPVMSTMLLETTFVSEFNKVSKELDIEFLTSKTTAIVDSTASPHSTFRKNGKSHTLNTSKPDVSRYKRDVRTGDIYDILKVEWNQNLDKEYTRKTAKKKLLSILNSPIICKSKEKGILRKEYPTVIQYFDELNGYFKMNSQKNKTADDKSYFAYLTQRMESKFILDIVCKKLTEDHPSIPIFTIHDAILTTVENKSTVMDVMRSEGKKYFGIYLEIK